MSNNKKKAEDINLKILRELVTHETNRHCFECNQRGPTYVDITIGSFVCTNCGGALRKYSHRVKSLSMSNFSEVEMTFLKKRGNQACRRIYFGLCDKNSLPEVDKAKLDDFLRQKYEVQKWYLDAASEVEQDAIRMNQEIFDRVEKGGSRNTRSHSINAQAGLIIQPPKPVSLVKRSNGLPANASATPTVNSGPSISQPTTTVNKKPKEPVSTDLFSELGSDPFAPAPSSNAANTSFDLFGCSTTFSPPEPVAKPASQPTAPPATLVQTPMSQQDRYAALAELDGILGNAATPNTQPPAPTSWGTPANAWPSMTSSAPNTAWSGGQYQPGPAPTAGTQGSWMNPFAGSPPQMPAANPFAAPTPTSQRVEPAPPVWNQQQHFPGQTQSVFSGHNGSPGFTMTAAAPPSSNPFMNMNGPSQGGFQGSASTNPFL